ncbi:Uncharacterised protein r2_g169 [Pycnogonum litorale]
MAHNLMLRPPAINLLSTNNLADAWKKFRQQFIWYLSAIDADAKPETKQCAILLSVLGEPGVDIYTSFTIPEEDSDKLDRLLRQFESYCTPRKNLTMERHKFNTRNQTEGEGVECYVAELKHLAVLCLWYFGGIINY